MRIFVIAMAVTVLFAACSGQKQDVKDTVFAPQVKAMEKVRSVEDTLKQGADKERKEIESSEKSDDSGY